MKRRELWLKEMQELAKSLEALGLTTLEGLTKKDLKKVCINFDYSVLQLASWGSLDT